MSDDSRVRNRISPIHTNSGSAVSAQFQLASHTVLASSEPAGAGENTASATKPTAISASAPPMPLASSSSLSPNRIRATVPALQDLLHPRPERRDPTLTGHPPLGDTDSNAKG